MQSAEQGWSKKYRSSFAKCVGKGKTWRDSEDEPEKMIPKLLPAKSNIFQDTVSKKHTTITYKDMVKRNT